MPFRNPLNRFPASQITGTVQSDQIANELIGKIITGGLVRTGVAPNVRWEITDGNGLDGANSRTIYAYSSLPHTAPAGLTITESPVEEIIKVTGSSDTTTGVDAPVVELRRTSFGFPSDPKTFVTLTAHALALVGDVQVASVREKDSGWTGTTLTSAGPYPDPYVTGPSVVFEPTRTGVFAFICQAYFRVATAGAECAVDLVIREGGVPFAGAEVFRQSIARSTITTFMQIGGGCVATGLVAGGGALLYNATLSVNRTSGAGNVVIAKGQIGVIPSL